jgi:Rieske Fe-S protein
MNGPSRRAVAKSLGLTGVAVVLAGCDTYGKSSAYQAAPSTTAASPATTGGTSPSGDASPPASGQAGGGKALASAADIPVGGGKIFDKQNVVVTQPTQGTFAAFSAVCTHQGCTVATVKNGTINCPCHGSKFRIADGSVDAGPAPRPLAKVDISVAGNAIRLT